MRPSKWLRHVIKHIIDNGRAPDTSAVKPVREAIREVYEEKWIM